MPLTEEERKKYQREYYLKNKQHILAVNREYTKKNKTEIDAYKSQWGQDNKDKRNKTNASYKERNRDKYLKRERLRNASNRKDLSDIYLKQVITAKTSLKFKDIPKSLIRAKRAYIKGLRLIKEQEDEG